MFRFNTGLRIENEEEIGEVHVTKTLSPEEGVTKIIRFERNLDDGREIRFVTVGQLTSRMTLWNESFETIEILNLSNYENPEFMKHDHDKFILCSTYGIWRLLSIFKVFDKFEVLKKDIRIEFPSGWMKTLWSLQNDHLIVMNNDSSFIKYDVENEKVVTTLKMKQVNPSRNFTSIVLSKKYPSCFYIVSAKIGEDPVFRINHNESEDPIEEEYNQHFFTINVMTILYQEEQNKEYLILGSIGSDVYVYLTTEKPNLEMSKSPSEIIENSQSLVHEFRISDSSYVERIWSMIVINNKYLLIGGDDGVIHGFNCCRNYKKLVRKKISDHGISLMDQVSITHSSVKILACIGSERNESIIFFNVMGLLLKTDIEVKREDFEERLKYLKDVPSDSSSSVTKILIRENDVLIKQIKTFRSLL